LIHRGKTLDYISGASVFSAYGTSYKELYQLAGAYTASEVIDRMIMEGQIHDQVYVQFDQFLHDMETIAFSHVSGHLKLFIDTLLMNLGYQTEEKRSLTLGHGIASVEQVIERKIRSVNLLSKSGMNMF
jgi:recombinational DNA repair protein (RecF pathway)